MAWTAAPSTTANNNNQNFSQKWTPPVIPILVPEKWQGAPSPQAVNLPTQGYPIG